MKLISIKEARKIINRQLKNKSPLKTTIYTFKQDRYISFLCNNDGLHIDESGYNKRKFIVSDPNSWKHTLKEVLNKEFPRSRNVYIKIAKN